MSFSKITITDIKPERFFLLVSLLYGLLFLVITPPYQSPDEVVHFYRAYQISEGKLTSIKQDNRVGGYIPNSIVSTAESAAQIIGKVDRKVNAEEIYHGLSTPLDLGHKTFQDFPNAAVYSPLSYLPQAIAISSTRSLQLPPLLLFYSARLISLLFWVLCIYISIRMIPFYKWLFVLLALLPMSIFTNMAMSADVMTNSMSFLLIAYFLKLSFSDTTISREQYLYTLTLAILLTSAKFAYAPLIILFLLIPTKQFETIKKRLIKVGTLFFLSGLTAAFWSWKMNGLYIDYDHYNTMYRAGANIAYGANIGNQINYILNHGTYIFAVLYDSIIERFSMYSHGYIGTFGWLDSKLPLLLVRISYLVILVACILDGTKHFILSLKQKTIILGGFLFLFILMFLMQHLAWGEIGASMISNLQGRYFIPIFPLLFLLFYSNRFSNKKILISMITVFTLVSLSYSLHVIYDRYYIPTEYKELKITCDGELLNDQGEIETGDPKIILESSSMKSFEGKSSIMLTPQSPYGILYTAEDLRLGDQLYIEAWAQGEGAEVVILIKPKMIYIGDKKSCDEGNQPWAKLAQTYTVAEEMANQDFTLYIFNSSPTDTAYFDNLVIINKKIQ